MGYRISDSQLSRGVYMMKCQFLLLRFASKTLACIENGYSEAGPGNSASRRASISWTSSS